MENNQKYFFIFNKTNYVLKFHNWGSIFGTKNAWLNTHKKVDIACS